MAFSIRLNSQEEKLARGYASLNGISLGEAFKRALFEKIEEEYDIRVADEAYKEFLNDPVTYSHESAWEEIFKDYL